MPEYVRGMFFYYFISCMVKVYKEKYNKKHSIKKNKDWDLLYNCFNNYDLFDDNDSIFEHLK